MDIFFGYFLVNQKEVKPHGWIYMDIPFMLVISIEVNGMVCFSDFFLILKWWRIDGDGMGKSWGLWGYDGCSHSMMDDHIIIYGWWMMAWMMELFLEWICLNLWKGWSWTDGGLIDKCYFWPFGRGWCWGLEGLSDDVQGILGGWWSKWISVGTGQLNNWSESINDIPDVVICGHSKWMFIQQLSKKISAFIKWFKHDIQCLPSIPSMYTPSWWLFLLASSWLEIQKWHPDYIL